MLQMLVSRGKHPAAITALYSQRYDFVHGPIVVAPDTPKYDIRKIVFLIMPDGSVKAILHAARSLTTVERNYS